MTGQPAVTLESVAFHWGDAYLISYARDRWVALRRDRHRFLTAPTLTGLETAIEADYRDHPVPRDPGPTGAADYLNPARHDHAADAGTPAEQPPPAPAAVSPASAAPAPTWFMPHPIQITCRHCGHTITCDTSSQAAHDKTCGPCAHPFPDHPSGPAA
jgi:hypothetical protein